MIQSLSTFCKFGLTQKSAPCISILRRQLQPACQHSFQRTLVCCCLAGDIVHYADLQLNRASHLRKDERAIQQLESSGEAQAVLLHAYSGLLSPLPKESSEYIQRWKAALIPLSQIPEHAIDHKVGKIFLGLGNRNEPHFAVSVPKDAAEAVIESGSKAHQWVELRREGGPNLSPHDAALMAYAAGMVAWASKNVYSALSGHQTRPIQGGHARGAEGERPIFTRIDPAVIMAVTCGDWLLLGRQSSWSSGRFSLLAGFCEIGETLEQAVARETLEEAGVEVEGGSVRYHSSQPWPFPQSLMIGFTAAAGSKIPAPPLQGEGLQAAGERGLTEQEVSNLLSSRPPALSPDENELEAAFWFHHDFLTAALQDRLPLGVNFTIPGEHALANRIITDWVSSHVPARNPGLEQVADVEIDVGRFKYVLLRVLHPDRGCSKLVVRGERSKAYHSDIVDAAREKLSGFQVDILGGGRIENSVSEIEVFGYSSAFGAAPHEICAALLQRQFPMALIRIAYSGY